MRTRVVASMPLGMPHGSRNNGTSAPPYLTRLTTGAYLNMSNALAFCPIISLTALATLTTSGPPRPRMQSQSSCLNFLTAASQSAGTPVTPEQKPMMRMSSSCIALLTSRKYPSLCAYSSMMTRGRETFFSFNSKQRLASALLPPSSFVGAKNENN